MPIKIFVLAILDIFVLAIWGALLLKYWVAKELGLLIHPNYFGLVVATGIILLAIASLKAGQLLLTLSNRTRNSARMPTEQHITLFPPGVSAVLLIAVALVGLLVSPKVFTSQTALQRGVTDTVVMTRAQPQSFKTNGKSEERSLIEWIRTLSVYPEPDAYTGQNVKVQGFVVHPPSFPQNYLMISRFIITCCAADAYPVGLPVKLADSNTAYPPDTWLEIQGKMITETLDEKRQLTIQANSLKPISKPENPYSY